MKAVYPTILTRTKDAVLVDVPDLDIQTEGKDISDAIAMARDAIGITGISMQDHHETIPEPSELQDIDMSKGTFYQDGAGIVTLVDIDFDIYRRRLNHKMVRRNVTLPGWLNEAADEAEVNVSGVLQEALKEKLGYSNEA